MLTNLIPLLSYVIISTFTPGPSNLSTTSVAVLHGYKNTLGYQAGLAVGVFAMMLLSGWISTTLLALVPALEPALRLAGAAYILYLAFGILKASYTFKDANAGPAAKPIGFAHGFLLQALNPKLLVYAFTLFTGFLAPIARDVALVVLAAALLAAISFAATSAWAIFGAAIKTYLRHPRIKLVVNIALALSLVYVAVALTGLI